MTLAQRYDLNVELFYAFINQDHRRLAELQKQLSLAILEDDRKERKKILLALYR